MTFGFDFDVLPADFCCDAIQTRKNRIKDSPFLYTSLFIMSNQEMLRIGRENDITGRRGVLLHAYSTDCVQKVVETLNNNSGADIYFLLPENKSQPESKPQVLRKPIEINRGDSL